MKKVLFVFFLLFIILSLNKKDNSVNVFKQTDYQELCIDVSSENVNTNNVNSIFNKIISIYPYFPDNYKKILGEDLQFIIYDNNFLESYKKLLTKLGENNWYSKLYIGIRIEKIKVEISSNELEALFSKHLKFHICNN